MQPSIRQRLSPFALQGGDEFNNPAIYQSLALVRTEEQDGIQSMADAKIVQYYALYCIYFATFAVPNVLTLDDPRFDDIAFPGWLISDSWGKTDVDPCEWHGIECDDNNRVTAIDLNENLLTGSFPKEVILLASDGEYSNGAGNLNRIDLYSNEFLFNDYDNSWMTHLGSNFGKLIRSSLASFFRPLNSETNLSVFLCNFCYHRISVFSGDWICRIAAQTTNKPDWIRLFVFTAH